MHAVGAGCTCGLWQRAKLGPVCSGLAISEHGDKRVADEPLGFAYICPPSSCSGVGETPKKGRRRNASLLLHERFDYMMHMYSPYVFMLAVPI